jgi:hypothetical protein
LSQDDDINSKKENNQKIRISEIFTDKKEIPGKGKKERKEKNISTGTNGRTTVFIKRVKREGVYPRKKKSTGKVPI